MRNAFGFPAVVNEKAARVVAGGVVLITATALLTGWLWLSAVLAVGFALRVAAGPRYSPLGQLATKVVAAKNRVVASPWCRSAGAELGVRLVFVTTPVWLQPQLVLGRVAVEGAPATVQAPCGSS